MCRRHLIHIVLVVLVMNFSTAIADPQDFERLGNMQIFWGYPQDIAVQVVGENVYLYATLNESTTNLIQIDATDPDNPVFLRVLPSPTWTLNTTLVGDYLYTGGMAGLISILDVSDPLNVDSVNMFNNGTSNRIRAVAIAEIDSNTRYAYFNSESDFQIWDFSDLESPTFLGQTSEGDSIFHAWRIVLDNAYHYAYMVGRPSLMLNIYDVSVPTAPTLVYTLPDTFDVQNVTLSQDGSRAYLATKRGLVVLDVTNPSAPEILTRYIPYVSDTDPWNRDGDYEGIALSPDETKIYLAGRGGYRPHLVKEAHNPDDPIPPGYEIYSFSENYSTGEMTIGTFPGDGLLRRGGLQILDISDLESIEVLGSYVDSSENIAFVDVNPSGSTAYIADNLFGLRIFDISDPVSPSPRGELHYSGEVDDVYIDGDLAFAVQNLGGGINIVDISDPMNPQLLGYHHTGLELWDFEGRVGDYIYTGRGSYGVRWGMQVVDISDPSNPVGVARYPVRGIENMVQEGNVIYGMTGEIFETSEPSHPRVMGSVHLDGGVTTSRAEGLGVLKVGPYIYLLNAGWEPNQDWSDFMIADVSDPRRFAPQVIGGCTTAVGEIGVAVWSQNAAVDPRTVYDSVYVALGTDGIGVVDVSDPYNPYLAHKITEDIHGYNLAMVSNIAIVGDYLYTNSYYAQTSMAVFDISNGVEQLELLDTMYCSFYSWTSRIKDGMGITALLDGIELYQAPGWMDNDTEAPAPVTGMDAQTSFDRVLLSWDLPTDPDWIAVKIMRRDDGFPSSISDGELVYDGFDNTAVDSQNIVQQTTYFYTAFAYDLALNVSSGGTGSSDSTTVVDFNPPDPATKLVAIESSRSVFLKWVDPNDADWNRTMIIRSDTGFVTEPSGGTIVYEGTDGEFEDIGVTDYEMYFYTAFSLDAANNYTIPDEFAMDWARPGSPLFRDDFEDEELGTLPIPWTVTDTMPVNSPRIYSDGFRPDWDSTGTHVLVTQALGSYRFPEEFSWGVRAGKSDLEFDKFIVNLDIVDPTMGFQNVEVTGIEWGYLDADNYCRLKIMSHYFGSIVFQQYIDGSYTINKVMNYARDTFEVNDWFHAKFLVTDSLLQLLLDGVVMFEIRGDELTRRAYGEYQTETLPASYIHRSGRVGLGISYTGYIDNFSVTALEVPPFVCGDADASGAVDIDDVVYLINYIFAGGTAPVPYESGDADCSGDIDIDDVVYLINYIFAGGPEPCAECP